MNLSDDEIEQYESELEDTTLKALLIQQNAYLHQILLTLQDGAETAQNETEADLWRCDNCDEVFPREKLKPHAVESHKAPPNMDIEDLATPYERHR